MKMMMKWTLSDLDNVCQENLWPVATHWQIYHIMLYRVHLRKNFYRKCSYSRFQGGKLSSFLLSTFLNDLEDYFEELNALQSFLIKFTNSKLSYRKNKKIPILKQTIFSNCCLSTKLFESFCNIAHPRKETVLQTKVGKQ